MFPAYPGFENLPLHIEVQWRGAARPVVARLEQWPDSDKAVLVCAFEDDEGDGEWIVRMGKSFYHLTALRKLLDRYTVYEVATRTPRPKQRFKEKEEQRLTTILKRAFTEDDPDCGLIKPFYLPNLPHGPYIVTETSENLFWCPKPEWQHFVPFNLPSELVSCEVEAYRHLQDSWENQESDTRFAWRWANLNTGERRTQLSGFHGAWNDLRRILELVLRSSTSLWQLDTYWNWSFSVRFEGNASFANSYADLQSEGARILEPWNLFLQTHFAPQPRKDWLVDHICARSFWDKYGIHQHVFREQPPTAHEQLEAKLQLRDWLQDKATPAEIEQLLAI